ncbi:uncharacterized protein [Rutidosis leptorrhynchoides]|uniref:uncharacterized protein n=1 Tax=Rutidosis leptorrhynchoides TaxID=125765 RepID=UPI003A98E592
MDSVGRSGGLALLWNEDEVRVEILSSSNWHIDAIVDGKWHWTGLYGHPDARMRHGTWELLRSLRTTSSLPWVVGGDFNELLNDCEKWGGNSRRRIQMDRFRECLKLCDLREIRCNNKTLSLAGFGPYAHLLCWEEEFIRPRVVKSFKFENFWADQDGCMDCRAHAGKASDVIREAEARLNLLLDTEESRWKQRAKIDWHAHRDRNTSYFHAYANQRRRNNLVRRLAGQNGQWITNAEEIAVAIEEHFHDVYVSARPNEEVINRVTSLISGRVTDGMN